MAVACKAFHHTRSTRVWHDGIDQRSSCARCRTPLIRDIHGWRPFDSARDADPLRMSKDEAIAQLRARSQQRYLKAR